LEEHQIVTIEALKQVLARYERQSGKVPELASIALELDTSAVVLKRLIRAYLRRDNCEGTAAFKASLSELLNPDERKTLYVSGPEQQELGFYSTTEAAQLARDEDLCLFVEPTGGELNATLLPHSKFTYEQSKRAKLRNLHTRHNKVLVLKIGIAAHDYQVKLSAATKFLSKGYSVNLQVALKNHPSCSPTAAVDLLNRFSNDLQDISVCPDELLRDGNLLSLLLMPSGN
jgi:translation initiation factor IF-3